jgi:hypothetical protein
MRTLAEAWSWYRVTYQNVQRLKRLGRKHWDLLPPDAAIWRDDHFRTVTATDLEREARQSLEELDDLAIVLLFSSFESQVRSHLLGTIADERLALRHPVLQAAAQEAVERIDRGSFARVLDGIKALDHDLVEQVRQVRRYRNWISHGKRGEAPRKLSPKEVYGRLKALLAAIDQAAS